MNKRLLLCMPSMSGAEMKYIQEAFADNWVVPLGPNLDAFEQDLRNFLLSVPGSPMQMLPGDITSWPQAPWAHDCHKQVVAVISGTAAIHLALAGCGVGPGDEVICQSFTFCASSNPIKYLGAKPVFVDSEPRTWNMDPDLLEHAIRDRIAKTGRKPRAIIVVHMYGMPARIDRIVDIASRFDIPVVEDAAEALGSSFKGRMLGTFGRFGVLSFNGNKMITTSGGGALICPDPDHARQAMFLATQAREGYSYYHHKAVGFNYRLSNISAGIGRGQMTVLQDHIAHHRLLHSVYADALRDEPRITLLSNPSPDFDSNFWLNTILISPDARVKGQDRAYDALPLTNPSASVTNTPDYQRTDCEPNPNVEAIRLALLKLQIESRPLWKPMHFQPIYIDAPAYTNGVSEQLFRSGLCLPSGPSVSPDDARRVIAEIRSLFLD